MRKVSVYMTTKASVKVTRGVSWNTVFLVKDTAIL